LEKELKKVRHNLFNAKTPSTKRKHRERDKELREEIAGELEANGWSNTSARQLAGWDPYDQNASSPFFDPEWMFDLPGFDIVIGNPPYVQIQKFPKAQKDQWVAQKFQTYAATADIYCLFYERGAQLLKQGGHLCYITSNKFLRAGYGKAVRRFLNEENTLQTIIDFGELPVFDAGTDPCILQISNQIPTLGKIKAAVVKDVSGIRNVKKTMEETGFELERSSLTADGWTLEPPEVIALLEKLRAAGPPLGECVSIKVHYGIKSGFDDAFVIDSEARETLIATDPQSAELIKPWLRGKDIRRWYADFNELYVINIQSSSNKRWPWSGKKSEDAEAVFKKEYPAVFVHLETKKEKLVARDDQGKYYWELRSCVYNAEFEQPKIVYADIAKLMRATYDSEGMYVPTTVFIIPGSHQVHLLGLLNSRLFDWYVRNTFQSLGDPWNGGRLRFKKQYMEKVPIPSATPAQQKEIESRVTTILARKKENPVADVVELEAEIDQLVYKLYDLTPEEIAIVEERG